ILGGRPPRPAGCAAPLRHRRVRPDRLPTRPGPGELSGRRGRRDGPFRRRRLRQVRRGSRRPSLYASPGPAPDGTPAPRRRLGGVRSVSACAASRLVDIEAEDTGVAILKFENGARGVIEATTAARPGNLEGSLSILGENGTVEVGGFALNEMAVWRFSDPRPE